MLTREQVEFIHALGPKPIPGPCPHPFPSVHSLTGDNERSEYWHKILNATLGWSDGLECNDAMINRVHAVWVQICDAIKGSVYFSSSYSEYNSHHTSWSIAILINFENIDDYQMALTMIKLTSLDMIRMHY